MDIGDQKRAHESFATGRRDLEQLIDAFPALVWVSRPDGFADFLNRRWFSYTGMSEEQSVGRGWSVAVHPDDRGSLLGCWEALLATGVSGETEARLRRADGEYRWFLFRGEPVRDASGSVSGWLTSNIDIDDNKRATETLTRAERELRITLDTIPALVATATPDGRVDFVNAQWSREGFSPTDAGDEDKLIHPEDLLALKGKRRNSIATGEPYQVEARLRKANGQYQWCLVSAVILRDETGEIVKRYSVTTDIDARKRADELLRASELELRRLVDTIPTLIWSVTPEGEPDYVSKRMAAYYGRAVDYTAPPFNSTRLFRALSALLHPDDLHDVHQRLLQCMGTGDPFTMCYRNRRFDGVYRWVEARAEPLRDNMGRVVKWYGVTTDIDDQKRAEEALRASEQELRQLVDAVPTLIYAVDANGEPAYMNERIQAYYGVTLDDLIEVDGSRVRGAVKMRVHPADQSAVAEGLLRSYATGAPFAMQYRNYRADGALRWVESRVEPLRDEKGDVLRWYGVVIDIDDQKTAEDALRASEARFRTFVDHATDAFFLMDDQANILDVNREACASLGYSREELIGMRPRDFDASLEEASIERLMQRVSAGETITFETRHRRKEGSVFPVEIRASQFEQGGRRYHLTAVRDIADRKKAEDALKQRDAKIVRLVESNIIGIYFWEADGRILDANDEFLRIVGYDREDLIAGRLSWIEISPQEWRDRIPAQLTELRRTRVVKPYEKDYVRKDGARVTVLIYDSSFDDTAKLGVCFALDLTERKRVEEDMRAMRAELARANRVATMGQLSASIAHELNQPLAAVIANGNACQRWLSADPPNLKRAQATLERIVRDANDAADIISRTRTLFRPATSVRAPINVNEVVAEVRALVIDEMILQGVSFDTDLDPLLPAVSADRVQIQQVLVNLLRNAMDAMRSNGDEPKSISVRTGRNETGPILIEVRDNGPGFEEPKQIFEPFFTTKESGMGMGLAICRSIAQSHGGEISARNGAPRGALFSFSLPLQPGDLA
jgi:PAS domain S-box-containing protein